MALTSAFFHRDVDTVAADLIGADLMVSGVGGIIVEVEAYDEWDPASHSYIGRTHRNEAMFGPAGHAYVYRIYGLHWCLNFVTGPVGSGQAVLVRALQPTHGLETMFKRRDVGKERMLCAGPGRLTEALAIDGSHNGASLDKPPFEISIPALRPDIVTGPRVGISVAKDLPRRFAARNTYYLSRPVSLI